MAPQHEGSGGLSNERGHTGDAKRKWAFSLPSFGSSQMFVGFLWATLAWALFFNLSGRIATLGWNIAEFVIASNLHEYGRYAFGAFQPTALWRPVLGTFFVFLVERVSTDPILSYCLVAATTLAAFTWSMYLCGVRLGGFVAGNVAAILAITTPAIGVVLLNSFVSLSHLAMLGVVGPATAVSLSLFTGAKPQPWRPVAAGLLWGLAVLARPDAIFAVMIFLVATAACFWRRKTFVFVTAAAFVAIWAPSVAWSSWEAAKYNLLTNQKIYQFYASQGYSVPPPSYTGNIEHAGYAYAEKLYGTPEENGGSVLRAMARNPRAVLERVHANAVAMSNVFLSMTFFSGPISILLALAPIVFVLALALRRQVKLTVFLWAAASLVSSGYLLLLHIDVRYMLISLPFAIILAAYTIVTVADLIPIAGLRVTFPWLLLIAVAAYAPFKWVAISSTHPASRLDLSPIKEMALQFINITRPTLDERAVMAIIIEADFPAASLRVEDAYAFSYFANTNLIMGYDSSSSYPVNRLFSFINCDATHGIVREDAFAGATIMGRIDAPVIGRYKVVKLAGNGCRPN